DARTRGQEAHSVSAESIESGMAQGNLPRKAQKNVQTGGRNRCGPGERENEKVIFIGPIDSCSGSAGQNDEDRVLVRLFSRYALLTDARPKSPSGEIHRTRMMRPNPRIWLLADPKAEISPASIKP